MLLSVALSVIALASAGAVPSSASVLDGGGDHRSLQASIACLAAGTSDFLDCCPNAAQGADPDDGVCTLLSCLELTDAISLRDTCDCADVVAACEQVSAFASVVEQLPDMCASVSTCCSPGDGEGDVANVDWDACMASAEEAGGYALPDFSVLIPGGIPVIEAGTGAEGTTTATAATDAADATTTDMAMFEPSPSVMCLVAGSDFFDCCPAADPADGLCTMLWCVDAGSDVLALRDGCGCVQVESACAQVSELAPMVPGLAEACAAVGDCCADDGSTTNDGFDACVTAAGLTAIPDLGGMVPGGLPAELGGDAVTTTTTAATVAGTTTTAATVAGTTATAATEPPPAATSGGVVPAGRFNAWMAASAVVLSPLATFAMA